MHNLVGSWWVRSNKDPRWNCDGRGVVGGFVCPEGAKEAIDGTKTRLKEEPPDDLTYEYMKD